jgi:hypothetical protein
MFGELVFQQTVGIPMGANFFPLLLDLFMYSNEAGFIQRLLKKDEKKLAGSFNVTFHYKAAVLSLNIASIADSVGRIYPIELEIKDYTAANRYVSYLDLHLEVDSEGRLRPKPYDLIDRYGKSVSQMATGMTYLSYALRSFPHSINTTYATSEEPEFTPDF